MKKLTESNNIETLFTNILMEETVNYIFQKIDVQEKIDPSCKKTKEFCVR